jgi:hypothetical protein
MAKLKAILGRVEQMVGDRTIPKNIRGALERVQQVLSSDDPLDLRIGTAIYILDEIINDPNMPSYARTQIWAIVSQLEQARHI